MINAHVGTKNSTSQMCIINSNMGVQRPKASSLTSNPKASSSTYYLLLGNPSDTNSWPKTMTNKLIGFILENYPRAQLDIGLF